MDDDVLPIDTSESMNYQSVQILVRAHGDGLLTYRWWTDMANPDHVRRLVEQVGEDFPLPDDPSGTYYLVYVADAEGVRVPVLLAEGEARPFALALALARDVKLARKYRYRKSVMQR